MELQATDKKVADEPALTQANIGFAICAGTDTAVERADVVLMTSDPYDVVAAVELSKVTLPEMQQDLARAVGDNVLAFPIAGGVLFPFVISPAVSALSIRAARSSSRSKPC